MSGSVVGLVGRLHVRVRDAERPGEVEVVVAGIPETWVAYAAEPLPVGARVLVVGDRGDRGVDVVAWDL